MSLDKLLADGNESQVIDGWVWRKPKNTEIEVQELEFDEAIDYRDYPVVEPDPDESNDDTIREVHWNTEE